MFESWIKEALVGEGMETLLREARQGDSSARSELLELYRNYLRLLARSQIDMALRNRLDPSDLVQDTLIEADRGFAGFKGTTEGELVTWLRRIFCRNLADQLRRHHAERRDLRREQPLQELVERSHAALGGFLDRSQTGPSTWAANRERSVLLAECLERLSPDHREVIILRHIDGLPFPEIATRMQRSPGAVRVLWARAIERLRALIGGES